jgi:hypothetical protein
MCYNINIKTLLRIIINGYPRRKLSNIHTGIQKEY